MLSHLDVVLDVELQGLGIVAYMDHLRYSHDI